MVVQNEIKWEAKNNICNKYAISSSYLQYTSQTCSYLLAVSVCTEIQSWCQKGKKNIESLFVPQETR